MELMTAVNHGAHVQASRERESSIIGTLHPLDAAAVRASGQRVLLPAGATLARPGQALDVVWFPEDAIVSLADGHAGNRHADLGLIGPEGLVGWQLLLGDRTVMARCTVELAGGHALAVDADAMLRLCAARPALNAALLSFVSRFCGQVARTLSATLHTQPDVRLARWLLLYHDRLEGDVLAITHQRLADLLGVRRATVTDWLHLMEGERLLRCTRGRVVVRDREGLIRLAGTAYGGVRGSLAAARMAALSGPADLPLP